jgi:hypothetical protein
MEPISTLANYAAVGALGAAALALITGREESGPRWMIRGTVIGGGVGLVVLITGGLS